MNISTEEILTSPQAAKWLQIHVSTLGRLTRDKKLPSFKIGGQHRYRASDLVTFIDRQQAVAPTAA